MPLVRDYKDSDKKINFLSGAGIILNKKTTQLILDKRNNWDHSEWEDVSLGKLLDENGVSPTLSEGKIFNIISITMLLTKQIITTRCRLDNHYGYPRFLEKFVFVDLYKIIKNGNLNKVAFCKKKYIFYFLKSLRVDSLKI